MLVCLIVIVLGINTCWVPFGLICLIGWQRNVVCLRYKIGVQCSIYRHVATNCSGDGLASQHVGPMSYSIASEHYAVLSLTLNGQCFQGSRFTCETI